MNANNFNNLFSKYLKGASLGSFLLAGLGYLALNSYYYGTHGLNQLISATMPSSSIRSQAPSAPASTARASTSRSPSSKNQSSTMCRPGRMKSLLRLPIEICKASNCQSECSSILRSTGSTPSTQGLEKIMSKKYFLLSATKS